MSEQANSNRQAFLLTRPLNALEGTEPVEGRTNLGFDELSPNSIPVIKRAAVIKNL
jgi:hypothetical protein